MKVFFTLLICLVWATSFAQTLSNIESVEYDPIGHRFLVGNGNNVLQVDGSGVPIEILGGGTPRADYGMEIANNYLFSIVGSAVKVYDLVNGSLVSSITISGAGFLNGMASDGANRIWVTDFGNNKIIEIDYTDIQNPTYSTVVSNTNITPNGICFDSANNRLVFVAWNGTTSDITAVSLADYSLTTLVANSSLNSIDGIDNDTYGNYYLASWSPQRITRYNSDFSVSEVITVPGGLSSAADIAYAEEIDTLVIPNSGNNTVRFVGFQQANAIDEAALKAGAVTCFPNPVRPESVIRFYVSQPGRVRIDAIDRQGRSVFLLLDEQFSAALQRVVVGDLPLSGGTYLWRIQSDQGTFSVPFIKE
jgi:sugar lactone lactonase YvrE